MKTTERQPGAQPTRMLVMDRAAHDPHQTPVQLI